MIEFSACVPRCLPTWSLSLSLHSALLSFSYTHPSIHLASFRRPPLHTHTQQSRAKANSNQSIRTRLMTRWMMMPRLYQSDLHIGLSLVSVSTTLARPFLIHPPTLLQTETHFGSDRVNRTKKREVGTAVREGSTDFFFSFFGCLPLPRYWHWVRPPSPCRILASFLLLLFFLPFFFTPACDLFPPLSPSFYLTTFLHWPRSNASPGGGPPVLYPIDDVIKSFLFLCKKNVVRNDSTSPSALFYFEKTPRRSVWFVLVNIPPPTFYLFLHTRTEDAGVVVTVQLASH